MKYQCTYCDTSSKNEFDTKFATCRENRHQIVKMLDTSEIRKSPQPSQRKTIQKVKGRVTNHYVESILVDDKPYFLCYNYADDSLKMESSIETADILYRPVEAQHCGYLPYSYTSSEITELLTKKIDKESLLDEIKIKIDRFLSLRELDKHLILGDILLTYCLEWISTLHFPFFVGENESGKSTVLHLARWLCYRCHLGEDIPMADVYNYLGSDEEGYGTIAEDEAQELWKNAEKIRMYKSSYSKGSKKARIVGVDSLGKHQVYYNTFCPKWFAGEKVPQDKGFLERIPIIHMTEGTPQSNIKRLSKDEANQLNQLRNRLLIWKVQNMNKGLERVDSGLTQRDQELFEDFLSVINGTKYFDKCKDVVSYYTEQRHQAIKNSLEARIFRLVIDKIDENLELRFEGYWNYITESNPVLPGKLDDRTGKTFYPEEFDGKITPQVLARIFSDKFQAKKNQIRNRNKEGTQYQVTTYHFDKDTMLGLAKKYGIDLPIASPLYLRELGSQGSQNVNQDDQVNEVTVV